MLRFGKHKGKTLKHEIEKENIDVFFEIVFHFHTFSALK
jgi:hypothetical protein